MKKNIVTLKYTINVWRRQLDVIPIWVGNAHACHYGPRTYYKLLVHQLVSIQFPVFTTDKPSRFLCLY